MLVSILLVFSATGCGKTSSAKKEEQIVFRMAIVDGESSPIYKGAKKMADEVLKKTNGRIKIVVVTGGALGDERGSVELCSQGDLDIASAANSVLTNWIPEMNILDQAYLWENEEQAHAAVDGPVGDLIEKAAYDKLNVHVIGYLESGFRDTFSKKPIKTMSDFKGLRSEQCRISIIWRHSSHLVQCQQQWHITKYLLHCSKERSMHVKMQ